jgi:hypothetical protein
MQHQPGVRITGIKKAEPNIRLFVLALIELARELESGSNRPVEMACLDADEEDVR